MNKYPHLFSPLKVGSVIMKNRIQLAPFYTTRQAGDGGFTDEYIAYIERVAQGGTGLITLGETVAGTENGNGHPNSIRLTDPKYFRRIALLAEKVHRHNALVSVEVDHGGIFAHPMFNNGKLAYAPCEVDTTDWDRTPAPYIIMDEDMMNGVADDFAQAIYNLRECGFDMAMLHFANGWLFSEFLSPRTNHRTDKYGGSTANRCRFPLMVLERVREKVGREFPLCLRLTMDELMPGGIEVPEAIEMAKIFEPHIDLLDGVRGNVQYSPSTWSMCSSCFRPRGSNVEAAAMMKKELSIPVGTSSGLSYPQDLEDLIASNTLDTINISRQLIADADWPNKIRHGREEDVNQCLRCQRCIKAMGRGVERSLRCTVNPLRGFEAEVPGVWEAPPLTDSPKNVLVVGGGPAGLVAALTAGRRGHQVTLADKAPQLGGALIFADHVPFKNDIKIYRDRLIDHIAQLDNITVQLNTEITAEKVTAAAPDYVVVAIGAETKVPPIPGITGSNVILNKDVFGNEDKLGDQVVIVGGGLQGAETAIHLTRLGKKAIVVEALPQVAMVVVSGAADSKNRVRGVADVVQQEINNQFAILQIESHVLTTCQEITANGVRCLNEDGEELFFPADSVIVSLGMRPLTKAAFDLAANSGIDYTIIGDCKHVAKITEAVSAGYFAAMDI